MQTPEILFSMYEPINWLSRIFFFISAVLAVKYIRNARKDENYPRRILKSAFLFTIISIAFLLITYVVIVLIWLFEGRPGIFPWYMFINHKSIPIYATYGCTIALYLGKIKIKPN